jgi:hypothetical protein
VKYVSFKYLWDFLSIPNTYYLKDYIGATAATKTPIQHLINEYEIYRSSGAKVYGSDGMPVVVSSLEFPRKIDNEKGGIEGAITRFTLNLIENRA